MLALMRAVQTANVNQRERALEAATYIPGGNDPDASHSDFRHYRQVGGSARDLPAITTSEIRERALAMRAQNPLARRYVDLVRELTTQSEWTVQAEDEAVQALLDDFWAGPYNQWPQWIGSYGDVLNTTGVLALPVWVNALDGTVSCGYADPAELSEPVAQPGNPRRIMAVKWTPAGHVGEPYVLTVVNPLTERKGKLGQWYGRLMAEDPRARKRPTGVLYFRNTCLPNETTGLSDLSAAIDPLANHETFMAASLEQAMLLGRFVGEVILKGTAGPNEVAATINRLKDEPMFASLAVHNEMEEHKYTAPSSQGYEAAARDRLHANYASSSLGIPPHILRGDMGEGNRAIAQTANDPAYLKVQAKMKTMARVARHACQYAIDCAVICGKLSPTVDATFTINTPKLLKKDLTAGAQTAIQTGQALILAEQREWVSRAYAQEVWARVVLPELGVDDITLEDIREDLEANGPATSAYGGMDIRERLQQMAEGKDEDSEKGDDEDEDEQD